MTEEKKRDVKAFLGAVFDGFDRHNGAQMSGSIAFFIALSAAPLVIVIAVVAVLLLGRQAAASQVTAHLSSIIGAQGTNGLRAAVQVTVVSAQKGGFAVIAAVVGTMFGAAGAVVQVRTSLNVILGRNQVSALRAAAGDWVSAIVAVFAIAIGGVVIVTSWVIGAGVQVLPGGPLRGPLEGLLSVAVYFGLATLAYRELPTHRPTLRPSLVGAAIATAVAALTSIGITIFLGTGFASSVYGTAASFFLFLMWLWLIGIGFIVGAELVRVLRDHRRGRA